MQQAALIAAQADFVEIEVENLNQLGQRRWTLVRA